MNLLKAFRVSSPVRVEYQNADATTTLVEAIREKVQTRPAGSVPVVICIGTDRSTGDALGPLVGSFLREHCPSLHVFGTLDNPVHAVNLSETIRAVEQEIPLPFVLAIDASLGQVSSIGCITFAEGPLQPGAGVNKKLPPVGHIHLTGIVNVGGFMEYFVLQNTRLSTVVRMANVISEAVWTALRDVECQFSDFTFDSGAFLPSPQQIGSVL